MFRSNLATYPYVSPINTYGENLGRAARTFLAALLAVDPVKVGVSSTDSTTLDGRRAAGTEELYQLAHQFESLMPNQAAELRYLAARDR